MTHILAIIVSQPLFPCSANSFLCYARFERFGDSATVDSRLRGNDGPVLVCLVVSPAPHLWIADQVRNDVTMLMHRFHPLIPCQALGQALVLCHQGRGGYGWFVLLYASPCGYCLKASMTATCSCHPVDSRLRGDDGPVAGMAVIFEGY